MSPASKNRLVGTIVIVAIAVIFLPDLLNGSKEQKRDLFVELPATPDIQPVKEPTKFDTDKVKEAVSRKVEIVSEPAVDEPPVDSQATGDGSQAVAITKDVKVVDQNHEEQSQQVESAPTQTTAEHSDNSLAKQTVVDKKSQESADNAGWVVQLGSFRHKKNVNDLLVKLEKGGYRAFSRPVKTKSGTLTKVFVGPDLDKSKLTDALSHLKQLTNLQGRVTPFTVQ